MQGYFGLVYLDSFVSGVPLTFTTTIDSTNIPLITDVAIQISPTYVLLNLTGDYLQNMLTFQLKKSGTSTFISSTRIS